LSGRHWRIETAAERIEEKELVVTDQNMRSRIGIVDFQLDNFHANTITKLLRGELASRGFMVAGATALDRAGGIAWCDKQQVAWFDSVAELDSHIDCYMILAPSNPELHLKLCEQVFPYGKPTFVDKTFAPDLATARQIFQLADQHRVAVQTSSALRYTAVQTTIGQLTEPVESFTVWAGGASFAEYGIHPVELVVSCLGSDILDVLRLGNGTHFQLMMRFDGERAAMIDFAEGVDVPYAAAITTRTSTQFVPIDLTDLFRDSTSAMLDFFAAGAAHVDRAESLSVRKILDRVNALTDDGRFHTLASAEGPRPHAATIRNLQRDVASLKGST
jgi:hypothetical protein